MAKIVLEHEFGIKNKWRWTLAQIQEILLMDMTCPTPPPGPPIKSIGNEFAVVENP